MYGSILEEVKGRFTGSPKRITITVVSALVLCALVAFLFFNTFNSQQTKESVAKSSGNNVLASKDQITNKSSATEPSSDSTESSTQNQAGGPTAQGRALTTPSAAYVAPTANTNQDYPSSTSYQPQAQQQAATCNEAMKASYTSLRDSKTTAENARWAQQVEGFSAEAARRGMTFSGYVQSQINTYKPAHDAKLSSIDVEYTGYLASINCIF